MHVDRSQFLKDGYVIFRECIPPEMLETLRNQFNILVARQKAIWEKEAQTEDLAGGQWETSAQPSLWYDQVTDRETKATVDFILHENTMGISRELMRCEDAAPLCFFLMCSPVKDHGPSAWHRDLHPIDQAPLTGLQGDLLDNGPGNIQWECSALRRRRSVGRTWIPLSDKYSGRKLAARKRSIGAVARQHSRGSGGGGCCCLHEHDPALG